MAAARGEARSGRAGFAGSVVTGARGKPAILAEGLKKSYGKTPALDGLDVSVNGGTVLGLLGPNGAGKTTAVRILTTLVKPDAGYAEVAGLDVARQADELRSKIGLAGQYAAVDGYLTGRENLRMVGPAGAWSAGLVADGAGGRTAFLVAVAAAGAAALVAFAFRSRLRVH